MDIKDEDFTSVKLEEVLKYLKIVKLNQENFSKLK